MPSLRILVVDDDDGIRDALVEELRSAGHDADGASNGAQALAKATAQTPDLMLLDFQMPDMHGDQVIAGVRARNRISTIPVVIVSASANVPADETVGFLRKPFGVETLHRLVDHFAEDAAAGVLLGRALKRECKRCAARAGTWCVDSTRTPSERLHSERIAATTML